MPLDRNAPIQGGTIAIATHDNPDPSTLQVVGAMLQDENPVVSALSDAKMVMGNAQYYRVDPASDPFKRMDDVIAYEKDEVLKRRYKDAMLNGVLDNVYNDQAFEATISNIQREHRNEQVISASSWPQYLTGVATSIVTDPTNLIPGGAFVRGGKVGYSATKSAVSVGLAAGGASALSETGLQATQETRTSTESLANVGGTVILGSLIGMGGAKFFSKGEWDRVGKSLKDDLQSEVPNPEEVTDIIVKRMQSAGAAAVENIKIDDLGIGGSKAAQIVANATAAARINPGIQTMLSPSTEVRKVYGQLVDNPIYTKMQMDGRSIGADVENHVKAIERGSVAKWLTSANKTYREAKRAGFEGTKSDFFGLVSRAGRRGDVDVGGNELVSRLAREARETIFDPLLERAKRLGLLPEDVKTTTAASYVTRLWNRQRLIARENEFRQIAGDYFREQIAKLPDDARVDFVSKADMEDYVQEVVGDVFDNLTGRGSGSVPDWLVPVTRGPLKERTFNIPDEMVEDFLENDMELILRRYARTMGAEVELTEKFGRADMKDQLDTIRREYRDMAAAAKTEKERVEIDKARTRDIKNLEAFRDMIRGTYKAADESSAWSRLTRAALTWNYIRLLGGVVVSSLTDAARPMAVHGLRASMSEAFPALRAALSQIVGNGKSGNKAALLSAQDARDLGAVTEVVLQSRLASLADLQDPYRYGSSYERFLSNTSNLFTKATGLGHWNDVNKTIAAVMTQNRMARNALNWNGAGKRERAYMAYLGIDEHMSDRIAKELKTHGIQEKNIWGANVSEWTDDGARRAWAAALNKDVDRTIVTKGIADTPLWTKTNWGRLIMQFKSFGLASHQRVLIAGLQERPHRLAEQMVFSTSLGMMVGYLKFMERGDWEEAERLLKNPGLWIADGLDRTGILAIPFEISNTAEKVGSPIGIMKSVQAIAGDDDKGGSASRYASRNKLGALAGPWAGAFQDLSDIAQQLSEGDLKKSGANAMIRQLPGATLPIVRSAIHIGVKPEFHEALE